MIIMSFKNLFAVLVCFLPSVVFSQDTSVVISNISKEISADKKTISDILTDTGLMYLHSLTAFREVIKK